MRYFEASTPGPLNPTYWIVFDLIFVVFVVFAIYIRTRLAHLHLRRSYAVSLVLLLAGYFAMSAILLPLSFEQVGQVLLLGFGCWFAALVIFVGGAVTGRGGGTKILSSVPYNAIQSFQQIKPDRILKTGNYTILKKNDNYILLTSVVRAVYFVRLFAQTPSNQGNIKLPILFTGETRFKNEVAGLPAAKIRGEIVIPVDVVRGVDGKSREKYLKGNGMEYVFPTVYKQPEQQYLSDLSSRFDRATILNILSELSEEPINP